MTTDFSGPEGRATPIEEGMREASAIADANQGICLGEVIPLITTAESGDFISAAARKSRKKARAGEEHYRHAIHGLTEAAVGMARDKNVAVSFDDCAAFARIAVDKFDAATVYGITKCHSEPIELAAATLNRMLDVYAANQVIYVLRMAEGYDQLDPRQVMTEAEVWMRETGIANMTGNTRYRWPDPVTMVTDYYRTRCSGPVSIKYPEGQPLHTGYFLDRANRGHVRNIAATTKSPISNISLPTMQPQLMRCPAFDRRTGSLIPEGRLVKTLPDGAVCTSWWKNGKLHRDPKAGPAWHRKGPEGEHAEYIVAGNLHRDPTEGAAVTSWNPDGTLAFEEFWQEGKRLQTDESTEAADA